VLTTEFTYIGTDSDRIALLASETRNATGAVSLDGITADTGARVRALQSLYQGPGPVYGPTIEVASMQVDASTGGYGFALPIASPRVRTYLSVNPLSTTFPADSDDPTLSAAGKYALEASIAGLPTQTFDIDLVLSGDVSKDFSFVTAP
jgi:hypothetical protein